MAEFENIHLVRHGHYDGNPEQITEKGISQSEEAAQVLASRELGSVAILLSSDAPRALQTAKIISERLSIEVMPSRRLNIVGNNSDGVASLGVVIEAALAENDSPAYGESLIIVAHEPLIRCTNLGAPVANGQVVTYEDGMWLNRYYSDQRAELLNFDLRMAGLEPLPAS
jgi:phosphohistidine phosphatase SixA